MANDLVRWGPLDGDGYRERDEPTHRTTTSSGIRRRTSRARAGSCRTDAPRRAGQAAGIADQDAADARKRGDKEFAFTRESDAADLRQTPWDWGDLRTWLIIGGMCVGVFLFTAFVYFMPEGRHAQNDGAEPVPHIRVY